MPHTKEGNMRAQIHGKLAETRNGKYSPAYENIRYHIKYGKNMCRNGFVVQEPAAADFLQNLNRKMNALHKNEVPCSPMPESGQKPYDSQINYSTDAPLAVYFPGDIDILLHGIGAKGVMCQRLQKSVTLLDR